MSNPSIESSPSLTDLFEYDEYDSYESAYDNEIADAKDQLNGGVPLSVELSESIHRQCDDAVSTSSGRDANDSFVKAPEIFLRFDGDASGATSATTDTNSESKTECDRPDGSFESGGSDGPVGCDIVELHYENEFADASADECDASGLTTSQSRAISQFENENEQFLFEGRYYTPNTNNKNKSPKL